MGNEIFKKIYYSFEMKPLHFTNLYNQPELGFVSLLYLFLCFSQWIAKKKKTKTKK